MDRFDQVETFHSRLSAFCRTCSLPSIRVYAWARFLVAMPPEDDEFAYFREEAGNAILSDLRGEAEVRLDGEERRTVERALESLRVEGVLAREDLARLLPLLTDGSDRARSDSVRSDSVRSDSVRSDSVRSDSVRSDSVRPDSVRPDSAGAVPVGTGPDGRSVGAATTAVVQVPVPLVCELPPVPGGTEPEYAGVLSVMSLSTRAVDAGGDAIRWHNSNTEMGANRLRLLSDTAADVRTTARETVYGLSQAGPSGGFREGVFARALRRMDVDRLGFDLSLPDKEMPIAGASISLALGVSMAGAMIGLLRDGRGLAPRGDLAWTGELHPSGAVTDVDSASLWAKVRAARAAGMHGLVVARTQGDQACQIASEVGWDGEIYTTGSLREIFDRSELLQAAVVPDAVVSACRRPRWQQTVAFTMLALLGVILLLLSPRILDEIGVHWFPPWRSMPRVEDLTVPRDVYRGFDLAIPRMADLRYQPPGHRTCSFAQVAAEVGRHRQPGPYLILGESIDELAGLDGRVRVLHVPTRRWVDEYVPLSTWLPNEPSRETNANLYTVKQGLVADVDEDDDQEILLSVSFNPSSRTALQILDEDLLCERSVEHSGHLERLAARDLTGDGRPEILAEGYHAPTDGLSLLVLETEDFYPVRRIAALRPISRYTTTGLSFDPERQPCLVHFVQPFRPWMGTLPESPLMQIGWPQLTLDSAKGSGSVVRTDAYLDSAASMIVSTTFDLPDRVLDIVPNQPILNRLALLHERGELEQASVEEALEFIVNDLRQAMCRADYIQR